MLRETYADRQIDPVAMHLDEKMPELLIPYLSALPTTEEETTHRLMGSLRLEEIWHPGQFAPRSLSECASALHSFGPVSPAWEDVFLDAINSSQNMALARVSQNDAVIEELSKLEEGDPTLFNVFAERLCVDGHNLHPFARARRGFSPVDTLAYANEYGEKIPIAIVAVRQGIMQYSSYDHQSRFSVLLEQLGINSTSLLRNAKLDPESYDVVLAHPWQLEHVFPVSYPQELSGRDLVPLHSSVEATASASLRTLLIQGKQNSQSLFVKASVAAWVTTNRRNISPATCEQSPALNQCLTTIVDEEESLRGRVGIVKELSTAYFVAPRSLPGTSPIEERERNLSLLFRESLTDHVEAGELAFTGISLYSLNPRTRRPLLVELISRSDSSLSEAACQFFDTYSGLLTRTFFTFLTRYGIGIEAHLQNTILVFQNGSFRRILLRDFGGIQIHKGRFTDSGYRVKIHEDNITMCDSIEDVYSTVAHACIHANLAEIARLLTQWCNIPYSWCAERFSSHLKDVGESFTNNGDERDRFMSDARALTAPRLPRKAYLRSRLFTPGDPEFAMFWPAPHPLV